MRRVALSLRLSADATRAVDHRFLFRCEMQLDRRVLRRCREIERSVGIHFHVPRFDPGEPRPVVETGLAETPATHLVIKNKALPSRVGDREVGELQVVRYET